MANGRTLVVRPHQGGFFSNFNKVISILHNEIGHCGIETVEVDWTLPQSIKDFSYGTPEDGNVWNLLFEPLRFENAPDKRVIITTYPEDGPHLLTGYYAYQLYKDKASGWREAYHRTFLRFIHVRSHLLSRTDDLMRGAKECFAIGVHYRHPGHNRECPQPIPSLDYFFQRIDQLARRRDNWIVVLATDVTSTLDAFRSRYGNRLISQSIPRSTDDAQLHETEQRPRVSLAEDVLVDALALARCDVLLHVTSNVATAVGYINPKVHMIYCESLRDSTSNKITFGIRKLRVRISQSRAGPTLRALKRRFYQSEVTSRGEAAGCKTGHRSSG